MESGIHHQELKWHCAECEAHFKGREKPKQKKAGLSINMPRKTNWIRLLVVLAVLVLGFLATICFILLSML